MKNILRYILTAFLLFTCISIHARSYTFRGLSVTDGLSDLVVNALYKDSIGFVWVGTGNSLERFDGIHLKHYLIPGANEKLKRVNVIAELGNNEIWMGNGTGLWRVNKEMDTLEQIAGVTINVGVRSLLYDKKETLYIGSEAGLFIYKNGNIERVMIDPNVLSVANTITGMILQENGLLWMSTGSGLCALRLSDKKIIPYHYVIDEKHICSYNNIARVGDKLYLGTMGQGIICFDMNSCQFSRFVDVGCNVISSLSSDGKDLLYVSTDGNGVHFISTTKKEIVRSFRHEANKDESLRSNSVYSLLVDRDGLIWMGFYQLGLDYTMYQSGLFTTYTFPPYFDSKDMPVRTIASNEQEKLIGSRDGLFYIDEKKHRFKSFKSPQLRSSMVMCSYAFRGKYYIGTYGGGMYVFDPVTLSIHDFDSSESIPFEKGQIFCVKSDDKDNLWIGTSAGLFCYKDGQQLRHYTSANSKLPDGNVYEIYFDSTHKGWICTENGMCIWDPSSSSLKIDVFPEGFIHKEKIRVVYEDSNHDLYFFPDKGTMFVSDLTMNRFRRLQPNTLLEGKDGMFIIEDAEKWLWIGTSNGLYRYDKKETFIPYNFVDGIPSSIFTYCPPVIDSKGMIWMGNSKGLIYVDSKQDNKIKHRYPVAITDIYVNGKLVLHPVVGKNNSKYEVSLDASQKNITIGFSGFTYTDPTYMSYEYRLEGEDEDWQTLVGKSDVTYYDLPSGNYYFKVRRAGNPDSEVVLSVKIASPISIWSLICIVIAILTGGYAYYFQKKKVKADEKEEVVVAANETKEVEKMKEILPLAEVKYKTNKVSAEECKRLTEKLEVVIRKEKLYTNPDLKIADLASAIGTSAHTLSYLFNQYLNRNYYDYINDYRIAQFKHLVNKDEYAKYTLSAMAELCGFSSRASFFRYFKKATGITPNEYIKSIGKTNE